ncbi:MAG TPA: chemotaxis-specific protein-glutamate methyltransferase CheB [Polyangia bacterium]|nr:chemotaxis-specific protein-glutamate methyltransferase CheB [Polyangia bacterium]
MNRTIRVLVIDDSAYNRQTITSMLEESPGVQVVGRAVDGEEGLRQAFQLLPDVITLDLEMPKMDGFSFLRILMSKKPMPVIVISGHNTRENVFKALELGALDFVAKPSRNITPELKGIKDELLGKVRLVTQLRMVSLADRAARTASMGTVSGVFPQLGGQPSVTVAPGRREGPAPPRLIAIGASTGGPPAITQILSALDSELPLGIVVTQHMPVKFTKAFAERLDRTTAWRVREAEPGDAVSVGVVLVAPGSGSLTVRREGAQLKADVIPPQPDDRFVPSVDRMFDSVARAIGADALGIILTGMGGDGGRGVRALKTAGGRVLAESPQTAVISGMPQEAIATGQVDEVIPLGAMADAITRFARR